MHELLMRTNMFEGFAVINVLTALWLATTRLFKNTQSRKRRDLYIARRQKAS